MCDFDGYICTALWVIAFAPSEFFSDFPVEILGGIYLIEEGGVERRGEWAADTDKTGRFACETIFEGMLLLPSAGELPFDKMSGAGVFLFKLSPAVVSILNAIKLNCN